MNTTSEWKPGPDAWRIFAERHPELGYRPGRWQFHNFLRFHRQALLERDAIRKAKGRFWIAHADRFSSTAFDCATGAFGQALRNQEAV